jgi:acyl-CoA synthetase (AMP-forming)/AMP-acid ligase II
MHIRDYLARAACLFPHNEVLVHGETRLTAAQLVARVFRVANALLGLGLGKGDRVAVLLHNCHQSVECFYGIHSAGCVLVPLNARNAVQEHLYILENAGARALLMGAEFIEEMAAAAPRTPGLEVLVCVTGHAAKGMHPYEQLLADASAAEPRVAIEDQDISSLRYTSGTTGRPKGVVQHHLGTITGMYNILTSGFSVRPGDTVVLSGPVTHASGAMVLPHIVSGGRVIVLSRFDPGEILALIEKERVTTLYLVPTMIVMLINHPDVGKYDLSSLQTIRYGASPISPDVLQRAIAIFGNVFIQGYGLTEASMPITILNKEDHILDGSEAKRRRLASIGRESMAARVGIMDEEGNCLPPGEVGEIVVRSKQVMQCYWKNEEATATAFRHGWLHTRDMGYRDEDGYLFLVDRKEDMIISGGFNVYPKEVEDVLYQHPAVLEAVVFGIPDEVWGEAVMAVISLKSGMAADAEEISAFCKQRLAGYKKPKSVAFIQEIPKTAVGKIARRVLRDPYWKDKGRNVN